MRRAAILVVALMACAAMGAHLAVKPVPARANGVPQLVKLTYLDSVSNWGPKNGEGVLEISFAEAHARVDVKNLPPVEGYTYEGWLVAPDGTTLLVAPLTVSSDGVGGFDAKLMDLKRYDYTLFVVAGRATAVAAGAIPPQKSIAGRFTIIDEKASTKTGAVRPSTLPDTGERPETVSLGTRVIATAGAMAGATMLVVVALRFPRRSRRND